MGEDCIANQDDSVQTDDVLSDNLIIGQRIAQWFPLDTGGKDIYFGTVVGIQRPSDKGDEKKNSETWYLINYDDGDREHVLYSTLQDMFKLYEKYGENIESEKNNKETQKLDKLKKKEKTHKKEKTLRYESNEKDNRGKLSDSGREKKNKRSEANVAKSLKRKNEDTVLDNEKGKPLSPKARRHEEENGSSDMLHKKYGDRGDRSPPRGDRRHKNPPDRFKPTQMDKKERKSLPEKNSDREKRFDTSPKNPKTETFLNRRVANYFGGEVYFGTIRKCFKDDNMWHVRYDDGDREDYTHPELQQLFKM